MLVLPILSCSSLGPSYLLQAAKGQLEMSNRARPIPEVLKDERVPQRVRKLLTEIPAIKAFGESQGLKPTRNYTEYVALDRDAASWVVSACLPLKFEPKKWSFPIVGSFTYVGWFDLGAAQQYAEEIRKTEGLDVDVRGASAYSTLGWFTDPVLSSMIPKGEEAFGEMVNVVLHESVHATFYLNGQSYFNESLASFVADEMTLEYFQTREGLDPKLERAYLEGERLAKERQEILRAGYLELEKLYASPVADEVKLDQKKAILKKLSERLKTKREINNATLIQFRTYGSNKVEFETLLRTCGSDWKRFMDKVRTLSGAAFASPHQEDLAPVILGLARQGC